MSQLKAKRDTNYSSLLQNEQDRNSNVHSSTWTEDEQKRIRRGQLPQSFTNFGEEYWHQQRKEWLSPPDGEPPKRRRYVHDDHGFSFFFFFFFFFYKILI